MTEPASIPSPLRYHWEHNGAEPAIISGETILTWGEMARAVGAVKGWLVENGFRHGDTLALVPEGTLQDVVVLLACCELGVIFCGFNARWPADKIKGQAAALGARFITRKELEKATRFAGPLPMDETWQLQRPVSIMFTSGSTGDPKAVVHTLGNHYYSALGSNENILLSPGDRWQLALPVHHVSGMGIVFRSVVAGSAIVISNELTVKSLVENRVTHLSLVSTQFKRLLALEETEKLESQMKAILLGGGPLPQRLIQQGQALNLPVFTSYGLSEMASQVATTTPNQSDLSSARVLPYREVKISTDGEILVRGETLFAGYLQDNGIDPARDETGWFHTRDSGQLDGNFLRVTGRLDNQFISGGENIQPEIIERALLDTGDIDSAIVVPVPDEEFGQRPFAFYASTHPIHPEEISLALRQVLPGYMLPVQFAPLPEEFRTSLKPSRQKLRDLAIEIYAPKS